MSVAEAMVQMKGKWQNEWTTTESKRRMRRKKEKNGQNLQVP